MISATHNYEIVWYILHKIQFGCLELLFSIRFKERYKKLNREKKLNSFQSGMSKTKIKNSQFDSYSRLGNVQLHYWQKSDCYIKSSAGWLGKVAIVWWLWMSWVEMLLFAVNMFHLSATFQLLMLHMDCLWQLNWLRPCLLSLAHYLSPYQFLV